MLLVKQKRTPVVLQMVTRFSKRKFNGGRPLACLNLPDLNGKKKQTQTTPHSKHCCGTPGVSQLCLLNSSRYLGVHGLVVSLAVF